MPVLAKEIEITQRTKLLLSNPLFQAMLVEKMLLATELKYFIIRLVCFKADSTSILLRSITFLLQSALDVARVIKALEFLVLSILQVFPHQISFLIIVVVRIHLAIIRGIDII